MLYFTNLTYGLHLTFSNFSDMPLYCDKIRISVALCLLNKVREIAALKIS